MYKRLWNERLATFTSFAKIFAHFLQKIYKKFCKIFEKNVQNFLQNVKKKFFFCVKFLQNFGKFEFYTQILDHVNSLAILFTQLCDNVPPQGFPFMDFK